ncbi:MAG: helix-turn-helix transcriptional regulator [Pseudonocardia sp.]|nr:helix-turn-helix transcriptional regulator [Pseudonocardia sp.]
MRSAAETDLITELVIARQTRRLSQTDVARKMYVSPTFVSAFERQTGNTRGCNLSTVLRYAEVLGLRIGVIYEHESAPHTAEET